MQQRYRERTIQPFPGLEPYGDDKAAYFFGRLDERRLIRDYLFASRLTILHGEAGVGKSSLVRAGVARDLREEAKRNKKQYGVFKLAVTVFPSPDTVWPINPQRDLMQQICDDVAQIEPAISGHSFGSFAVEEAFDRLTEQLGGETGNGRLFIILDQFDEYVNLATGQDGRVGHSAFISGVGRMLSCFKLGVNFLVCIRSECLSKLERLEELIPNILKHHLQIEPLSARAAHQAITGPIKRYNQERSKVEREAVIDERLVETIIGAVGGQIIESPYLQIVMTNLWNQAFSEVNSGRPVIFNEHLLTRLGGAEALLRHHVRDRLSNISVDDLHIAERVLPYLVTPSSLRTIPQTPQDLLEYANLSIIAAKDSHLDIGYQQIQRLLNTLSTGVDRILRPMAQR